MTPPQLSNSFSTGGGGTTFEELVGTYYLVALLAEETPRGLDQGITRFVRFQQSYRDTLFDDIRVVSETVDQRYFTLDLQVKHDLVIGDNTLFRRVLSDAWGTFTSVRGGQFIQGVDRLGIAVGEYDKEVDRHLQPVLDWARTSSSAKEFFEKLGKPGYASEGKKKFVSNIFKSLLMRDVKPNLTDDELFQFLRHLTILHFDLEHAGARDRQSMWNSLLNLFTTRDDAQARNLAASLFSLVAQYNNSAAGFDYETLRGHLSGFPFRDRIGHEPPDKLRKQYLEKISTRYHVVALPIGPAEGMSLQAIFQPLALRRDPLTVDLEHQQRRTLLGEERGYERSDYHRKDEPSTKEQLVIAEHSEDALKQSRTGRLIILGGPGTGKTTTLKHLVGRQAQRALVDPAERVPVFLSLADWAQSQKTLQSYLLDQVEKLSIKKSYADILWNEMQRGRAFVALDGLDEVIPEQRPHTIELVKSHASEQDNVWIVSSRFTKYRGGQFKQEQFSEWELLPMDTRLRRELATKLLPEIARQLFPTATSATSPLAFVTAIEKHPRTAAWGDNPLLFSLAAVVFVQTGGLPASRTVLYQKVIEAVLTLRDQDNFSRANLLQTLAGLAFWLQQEKQATFTDYGLLAFLETQKVFREEATRLANQMVTSGILDTVGYYTYGFRHQTFQEYLASVEIAKRLTSQDTHRREKTWQFIWKRRTYSHWTEVLRLTVGALAQLPRSRGRGVAFRWLEALLSQRETQEGDPGELGLALALKSAVEVTGIPEWKSVKTAQLERQLVTLWWHELLAAARNGRETKSERLEGLVQDVKHLQLCDREALSNLIVTALGDPDAGVHKIASRILQELSDWTSTNVLLPLLKDTNTDVRQAVVQVLGIKGEYDPLLPLLKDTKAGVRQAVVQVLGTQGEHAPWNVLLPLLQDENAYVREIVAWVLEEQCEYIPSGALLPLLQNVDGDVRRAAVRILGAQGEHIPLLPLLQDTDWYVRKSVVQVLGEQREHLPLEALLSLLADIHWEVRKSVVQALGARGEYVSLLPLLWDKDVRETVVNVLLEQSEHISLDILLPLLQDKNAYVRKSGIQALWAQREHVPVEALLPLLADTNAGVRQAVVEVFGEQREHISLDILLSLLQDDDESVRWTAVEVLGTQGEHAPVNALLPLLEDTSDDVRVVTIQVLGTQGEHTPLDALLPLLQDKTVRKVTISVLGKQGERISFEQWMTTLWKPSPDVQSIAWNILKAQGKYVTLDDLRKTLRDEEDYDDYIEQIYAIKPFSTQGKRILDTLLPLDEDEDIDEYMERTTVHASEEQKEYAPLSTLLPLDEDEDTDEYMERTTIQAPEEQKEPIPLDTLLSLLADTHEEVRRNASKTIEEQGERVPVDILLPLLQETNEDVRMTVVQVLGRQGEHVPVEALLPLLADTAWYVRRAVVQVLGAQGERTPVDALLPLLQDTDQHVRWTAVDVLGAQGERTPVDALLPLLQDTDKLMRKAVVQSLGVRIPIAQVLDLLKDETSSVRDKAVLILKEAAPDTLSDLALQAIAVLEGKVMSEPFMSLQQLFIAETLGDLGLSAPLLLERLTELLIWPFWQVRLKVAEAVGKIRRNIPDSALLHLYHLRRNDPAKAVRDAADDALTEILSLETSIEDD